MAIEVSEKSNGEAVYGVPLADLLAGLKLPSNLAPIKMEFVNLTSGGQGLKITAQAPVTETKSTIDPVTGTKTPVVADPAQPK